MIDPASRDPATAPAHRLGLACADCVACAYGGDYNPEQWPRGGVARGHRADARGRRQPGQRRHLLLGAARAGREGEYRLRLARPAAGPAARRRHPGRPRHPDGVAARLVLPRLPAGAAGHPRRRAPRARARGQASAPARRTYRAAAGARSPTAAGPPVRRPPGPGLWHVHNEYGAPVSECYCEISGAAFRDWLQARYGDLDALNEAWGTTFWGQRYGDWAEIDAAARSPRPSCNPAQRLDFARFTSDALLASFRRRARHPAPAQPRRPGHHQLHAAHQLPVHRLLGVGARGRRRLQRPLPAGRARRQPRQAGDGRRPHPVAGRRAAVAAHGALHQRGQLAAPQPRQAARRDAPATASRTSPAAPTACCSSSGGRPGSAPRSSTRRCCRTPAPTPGSGARSSRSARTWAGLAEIRGSRVRADVAMVWDWQSWWAQELEWRPWVDLDAPRARRGVLPGAVATGT